MLKRFFIALCLVVIYIPCAFAETCPTISAIKQNTAVGWKAYDSEDNQPLSAQREARFRQAARQFVLAEWSGSAPNQGAIHCFYRDHSGSNLEAYFAKEHFSPKKAPHHFWYQVSGHMHCAAGAQQCEFENLLAQKQYAKK